MPNALAVLIPFLVGSFQDVLRQTGFALNGVTLNATAERAAQGQTIQMLASAPQATYAVTPGVVPPAAVDTTPTAKPLIMTQLRGTRFHLTGEDWKSLGSMGPEFRSTQVMEAQAALIHELSGYILGVADLGAGQAVGTPGTSPFATDPDIIADLTQSLDDTLAPTANRFLALTSQDKNAAFKLDQFQRLQDTPFGTSFASGELGQMMGFVAGMDQSLPNTNYHTKGTGAAYTTTAAGFALGQTSIPLITGAGTILAGDVVTFAGDLTKYVVGTGIAAPGTIILNEGLRQAIPAAATALTVQNSHRVSLAMHKSGIELGVRPPSEPVEGDASTMQAIIKDPTTGISMRLAYYPGYHLGQWELSILYGAAVRRSNLVRKLIG